MARPSGEVRGLPTCGPALASPLLRIAPRALGVLDQLPDRISVLRLDGELDRAEILDVPGRRDGLRFADEYPGLTHGGFREGSGGDLRVFDADRAPNLDGGRRFLRVGAERRPLAVELPGVALLEGEGGDSQWWLGRDRARVLAVDPVGLDRVIFARSDLAVDDVFELMVVPPVRPPASCHPQRDL